WGGLGDGYKRQKLGGSRRKSQDSSTRDEGGDVKVVVIGRQG
ncbi:hypothetical protein, partial [Escherichia coli]